MKNKITITLQYPNRPPVIFFERGISKENNAQAFQAARKFIIKNVKGQGRKMPLIKLQAPAGFAPISMDIFFSKSDSSLQTDAFLFGNLNVLQPDRQHSEQYYTSESPKTPPKIRRQNTQVRIPVGA